jgi:hypothetical protein
MGSSGGSISAVLFNQWWKSRHCHMNQHEMCFGK